MKRTRGKKLHHEVHKKIVKSERQSKEMVEKKLEMYRREMKRYGETWDKEKNELWKQFSEGMKKKPRRRENKKVQEELSKEKKRNIFIIVSSVLLFVMYHFFLTYFINTT